MPQSLTFDDFFQAPGVILDARSPGEYEQGHIPEAISFPLFDNEERAQIGTCYKQQGQELAVELGLAIVSPKLVQLVQAAKKLAPDRHVRLHCWRGGMRSGSMAMLLEAAGMKVALLENGYKAYRRWVRSELAKPKAIVTLGGMTGTGKTALLQSLANQGEQILDLEALANHRGSSYGSLGLPAQPTTEQFENLIAMQWMKMDHQRPVWVEAESRRIGACRVPEEIFLQMMESSVIQVERSQAERIAILLEVYGAAKPEELIAATERISKKLGGQNAKSVIEYIQQGQLAPAIAIVLAYYDKAYRFDLQRRNVPIHSVEVTGLSIEESVNNLIQKSQKLSLADRVSPLQELAAKR